MNYYLVSHQCNSLNMPLAVFTNKHKCYEFIRMDNFKYHSKKKVELYTYKTFSEKLKVSNFLVVNELLINKLPVNPILVDFEQYMAKINGGEENRSSYEWSKLYALFERLYEEMNIGKDNVVGKEQSEYGYVLNGLKRSSEQILKRFGVVTRHLKNELYNLLKKPTE